jgi:hypothetical protein
VVGKTDDVGFYEESKPCTCCHSLYWFHFHMSTSHFYVLWLQLPHDSSGCLRPDSILSSSLTKTLSSWFFQTKRSFLLWSTFRQIVSLYVVISFAFIDLSTLCTPKSVGKLYGISQHTELCSNVHVAMYCIHHIFYDFHIYIRYICSRGPGSVVGIATVYGLDGPGIESRWGRDFPHLSRPVLRPTQPPVPWAPGLSRG